MGLFDKKKKETPQTQGASTMSPLQSRPPYELKVSENDGKYQIELIENSKPDNQFYDTTRLIIDGYVPQYSKSNPPIQIMSCRISWYGQSDAIYLGADGKDSGRRGQYKTILVGIDPNLFRTDQNYLITMLRDLLNETRVSNYLQNGLQEHPQRPCGNYVGGLRPERDNPGKYEKFFNETIGKLVHNSPEMTSKRQAIHDSKRQQLVEEIKQKEKELEALKQQLYAMDHPNLLDTMDQNGWR